jgi:archaeal flagellar protein FlaF
VGLSVSGASAILFIAFVVVFGSMFTALDSYQQNLGEAYQNLEKTALDVKSTSISFVSVDAVNDTFTIKNDGDATLIADDFNILINGTLIDDSMFEMSIIDNDGSRLLLPGDLAEISLSIEIDNCRIKVITGAGVSVIYDP